ncbi:hypothetical protein DFJ74DRAFT_647685 [Hyaloraphidium curvatum]|nr:hypothetical protein DFJ74DRAFT_647685 [Hyaloraphidium curvatum]
MTFDVRGRAALVSGGTEGIGRAVSERLLSAGCRVVVASRDATAAAIAVAEMRAKCGVPESHLVPVKMDICDRGSVRAAWDFGVALHGRVDVVVANAGFAGENYLRDCLLPGDDGPWIRGIEGNLVGTLLLCRLAASAWLEDGMPAACVITSSTSGLHGLFGASYAAPNLSYLVAKSGQVQFAFALQGTLESLARERGQPRSPIRVNVVMPGPVWTRMLQKDGSEILGREIASPEDMDRALPGFSSGSGGWTPMDGLVDVFWSAITDEKWRGRAYVVSGDGGEPKRYPKGFVFEDYLSRKRGPRGPAVKM